VFKVRVWHQISCPAVSYFVGYAARGCTTSIL
jgi:hypothetical protein